MLRRPFFTTHTTSLTLSLTFLLFFSACTGRDFAFQEYAPTKGISLGDLLDETPALKSAFNNLDAPTVNEKLDRFLNFDSEVGVATMFSLSEIQSESNPALPDMMDALARASYSAWYYYESDPVGVDRATNVGTRLLDVEPSAITSGAQTIAEMIAYFGNNSDLFTAATTNKFPPFDVWQNCEDTKLFDAFKDNVNISNENRELLLEVYDILRLTYCIYDNLEDVSGDASGEPGAFMKSVFETLRDDNNVEARVDELIFDLDQESNLEEIEDFEQNLADWLLADPDKKFISDYMAEDLFRITRKNFILDEGKPLLDVAGMHWAKTDSGNSEYYLRYVVRAFIESLPKMATLEEHADLEPNNPVHESLNDLFSPKDSSQNLDLNKNNFSLRKALNKYDPAQASSKLVNTFWNGRTYTPASGAATNVKGLVNTDSDDGYLYQIAQNVSTQNTHNHFREEMMSNLAGMSDLVINPTYNGETMLRSLLNNFYLYMLDSYYSPNDRKWAVDPADGETLLGDTERNLRGYMGGLVYNLRNLAALNPCGSEIDSAGDPEVECIDTTGMSGAEKTNADRYNRMSHFGSFLYLLGGANGIVDPDNAPATLTLQSSLDSMGAQIVGGVRSIELLGGLLHADIQVACLTANNCSYDAWRNGQPYAISVDSFDFELLTPGRFVDRTVATPNWVGQFSAQQGDVETTETKTANWMMSLIAMNAWEGFGPYTAGGKAPNGSKLKYENDYYTDTFETNIKRCTGEFLGFCTGTETLKNHMGHNGGFGATGSTVHEAGTGNYHLFEGLYRPMSASDPCWSDAGGDSYGYARYAYLRPTANLNYHDTSTACNSGADSYQNNPSENDDKWRKIQVDFDSREEAIRTNFLWVMRQKKIVLVMPMYGETAVLGQGSGFSVYATIQANGIIGIATAHRAVSDSEIADPVNGFDLTYNGRWNSNKSINMLGAAADGVIDNGTLGFIPETANSADNTYRFGRTSFADTDSSVTLEMTVYTWGGLLGILVDLSKELWQTLGNGPLTPALLDHNIQPFFALADSLYEQNDLLASTGDATNQDMSKFRKFYDRYFPNDDFGADGSTGSDGNPDLYQKLIRSGSFPGCLDGEDEAEFCLTESEMPPIPRVSGIAYPKSIDEDNKSITEWYTYAGPNEGKFTKFLLPFIMLIGTLHEDGEFDLTDGSIMAAGEDPDDYYESTAPGSQPLRIRNYRSDGLRMSTSLLLDTLISLNELKRFSTNTNNTDLADNLPAWDDAALLNIMVDGVDNSNNVTAGSRQGFLRTLFAHKYLNLGNLDAMMVDLEGFIGGNISTIMDRFPLLEGLSSASTPGPDGETVAGKDKLRYFLTSNVTDDVGENYLRYLLIDGEVGEPLTLIKKFLSYLRSLSDDDEILGAVKKGIQALNKYFEITGIDIQLNVSDSDVDDVVSFLNDKNKDGEFTIDSFIDFLKDNEISDVDKFRDFKFNNLDTFTREELEDNFADLNDSLKENFNEDIQKQILFSGLMLGEPVCDVSDPFRDRSGPTDIYYDYNQNGEHDEGLLTFNATVDKDPYSLEGTENFWRNDSGTTACGSNLTVNIPDYFNFHVYNLRIDRFVEAVDEAIITSTETGIQETVDSMYSFDFTTEMDELAVKLVTTTMDDAFISEPYRDRDEDGQIRPAEIYTDGSNEKALDGEYSLGEDFIDTNGNGYWDSPEFTDLNGDGEWTDASGLGYDDIDGDGVYSSGDVFFDRDSSGDYSAGDSVIFVTSDADSNSEDDYYCYYGGEPYVDLDGNGSYDLGEDFFDRDNNGVYNSYGTCLGSKPVTIRHSLIYFAEAGYDFYNEFEDQNNMLTVILDSVQEMFNPRCSNYPTTANKAIDMETMVTKCMDGKVVNNNYQTENFRNSWVNFFESTDFQPEELLAMKDLLGAFLYDTKNNQYTSIGRTLANESKNALRSFQGILQLYGENNDLVEASIESFGKQGLMVYLAENLKPQDPYTSHDVLRDIHTLMQTKAMRCYPGKSDANGILPYCKGLSEQEMFWPQISELSQSFARLAYTQKSFDWSSSDSDFSNQFKAVFGE